MINKVDNTNNTNKIGQINQIKEFINNIVNDAGANGIVLGLSGGIDSALVAYLAADTIASENILAIHMKTDTTPVDDTEDARIVANALGIEYYEIAIDDIANSIEDLDMGKNNHNNNNTKINDKIDIKRLASGNLKARIRMSILYYHANLRNYVVAGTGNRSELLIGYFTKYGDGGCDMLPIGDLYKTEVREIAESLDVPKQIITKAPRAGLWENQSDEKEIGMTYDVLDRLLYLIVDENLDDNAIAKEIDLTIDEINSIRTRIANNQHKLQATAMPSTC
ncbi:MAG: NAD+ synthase [Methanobacteriaceae archaeon]